MLRDGEYLVAIDLPRFAPVLVYEYLSIGCVFFKFGDFAVRVPCPVLADITIVGKLCVEPVFAVGKPAAVDAVFFSVFVEAIFGFYSCGIDRALFPVFLTVDIMCRAFNVGQ